MRVLVVLLAFEVGGLAALVAADCCELGSDACGSDDPGGPCQDCPPECPLCHCGHGSLAPTAARVTALLPPEPPHDDLRVLRPYEASAPAAMPPASIERPPKRLVRAAS